MSDAQYGVFVSFSSDLRANFKKSFKHQWKKKQNRHSRQQTKKQKKNVKIVCKLCQLLAVDRACVISFFFCVCYQKLFHSFFVCTGRKFISSVSCKSCGNVRKHVQFFFFRSDKKAYNLECTYAKVPRIWRHILMTLSNDNHLLGGRF